MAQIPSFHVKAVFNQPGQLLRDLPALLPADLLVLGLNFHPRKSQIPDWIHSLTHPYPLLPILVQSLHHTPQFVHNLLQAKIPGFLLKDCAQDVFYEALHKLTDGGFYYQEGPWKKMQALLFNPSSRTDHIAQLTPLERQLLLMALSQSPADVTMKRLNLSSIRYHRHWFLMEQKFGTKDPWKLLTLAVRNGQLP